MPYDESILPPMNSIYEQRCRRSVPHTKRFNKQVQLPGCKDMDRGVRLSNRPPRIEDVTGSSSSSSSSSSESSSSPCSSSSEDESEEDEDEQKDAAVDSDSEDIEMVAASKPFVVKSAPKRVKWTPDDDRKLREGVREFGQDWVKISSAYLPKRAAVSCRQRSRSTLISRAVPGQLM